MRKHTPQCYSPGIKFPGTVLSTTNNILNPTACQALCKTTTGCTHWTYYGQTLICEVLKAITGDEQLNGMGASGKMEGCGMKIYEILVHLVKVHFF